LRPLLLSLILLATGCATTPRARSASERLIELKRERQTGSAPTPPEAPASEPRPIQPAPSASPDTPIAEPLPTPPEPSPTTPGPPPATPTAPEVPPTPERPLPQPAQVNGPQKGAWGLHGSFGGTAQGGVSLVGMRYFVADWVGLNLEAGFSFGSAEKQTVSGLGLGVGVNLYGDSPDAALRPYFTSDVGLTSVTTGSIGLVSVSVSAGGGLEYWILPRLSVNASLLLSFAASPEIGTFAVATVRPGMGVTLYTP
jgi:hypothetical protein